MLVEVTRKGNELHLKIEHSRIEGENFILTALRDGRYVLPEIELIIFDMDRVDYMNSLGITEFVNIHRIFSETGRGRAQMRFINVEKKVQGILELVELDKIAQIIPKDRH